MIKLKNKPTSILLLLLLFTITSLIIGYTTNKNLKPVWYSMYKIPFDPKFEAISNAIHSEYKKHGVILNNNKPIQTFMKKELIKIDMSKFAKNHPSVSSITFDNGLLALLTSETKNVERITIEIIETLNEDLQIKTKDFLSFYGRLIKEKIELDLEGEYTEKNIQALMEKDLQMQIGALDKFMEEAAKSSQGKDEEYIEGLYEQLKELFYLRNMPSNSSKYLLERFVVSEKIRYTARKNLRTLEFLENELTSLKYLKFDGLEDRFNRSPSLKMSIISFGIVGFLFGLLTILIYSILSQKTLRRKLSSLLSLK